MIIGSSSVKGSMPAFIELYRTQGWQIQLAHLGCCMGYYSTEFGDVNGIVHLWAFDDLHDRTARRTALNADPQWQTFLKQVKPLLASMHNCLLNPMPFAVHNPVTVKA